MAEQAHASPPGMVRVRLERRFTPDGACALRLLARRLPPGTRLDLDLGDVRECQEEALLALAGIVAASRLRCAVRGLTQHQARLLEYLGAQVSRAPAPPADAD